MSSSRGKKSDGRRSSTAPPISRKNDFCLVSKASKGENRVKIIYPETSIPTISLRVPETTNEISYWQIGTVSVTRVKINALRPDVKIKTEEAGQISGMFSELYSNVSTLGTAIIHICGRPVKVNVTRSKQAAPIVADGIIGVELLRILHCGESVELNLPGSSPILPLRTGEHLIIDYLPLLRRRCEEASRARENGPWSVVSKELARIRKFLPPEVTKDERLAVVETLEAYADCFHAPGDSLEATTLLKYKIRTKNDDVIASPKNAKLSPNEWTEIDRQIDYLLAQNIIRESASSYNSPIRLIEKKPNFRGEVYYRLVADFHELNKHSEGDAFPIPDIIELVDLLHGSKYFSVFDLASACYQIELDPHDREKTAFSTRTERYEFLRMPHGIKNASQNIQRLLNLVIDDMLYSPSMAFVSYDDIIVHAPSIEEHEVRVRKLLARIRDAGLKLQPAKCQLFAKSVTYLGYLVTDEGLRPDPAKIDKIRKHELPQTRHGLSCFLGLLSSFKRFVPNHAERVKPMSNLLKCQEGSFAWTAEARKSFNATKMIFTPDLLLRYPNWNETFILETSSSDVAIQAALLQKNPLNGDETFPIAYASRCYTPGEMNYGKLNRERLAAMYGMETWYWYLSEVDEKKFVLRTPEPRAFDWYVKRAYHNSDILRRFEISFSGREFTVEALSPAK